MQSILSECLKNAFILDIHSVTVLARRHMATRGRWILACNNEVDEHWYNLCHVLGQHQLGPYPPQSTCLMVECSSTHYLLSIFSPDYTDWLGINALECAIRLAGVSGEMTYQADVFSALAELVDARWVHHAPVYMSIHKDDGHEYMHGIKS